MISAAFIARGPPAPPSFCLAAPWEVSQNVPRDAMWGCTLPYWRSLSLLLSLTVYGYDYYAPRFGITKNPSHSLSLCASHHTLCDSDVNHLLALTLAVPSLNNLWRGARLMDKLHFAILPEDWWGVKWFTCGSLAKVLNLRWFQVKPDKRNNREIISMALIQLSKHIGLTWYFPIFMTFRPSTWKSSCVEIITILIVIDYQIWIQKVKIWALILIRMFIECFWWRKHFYEPMAKTKLFLVQQGNAWTQI